MHIMRVQVIDLTGGSRTSTTDNCLKSKSQSFLQQQRDLMMRQTSQSNDGKLILIKKKLAKSD